MRAPPPSPQDSSSYDSDSDSDYDSDECVECDRVHLRGEYELLCDLDPLPDFIDDTGRVHIVRYHGVCEDCNEAIMEFCDTVTNEKSYVCSCDD